MAMAACAIMSRWYCASRRLASDSFRECPDDIWDAGLAVAVVTCVSDFTEPEFTSAIWGRCFWRFRCS